ncbi:hypothetical protein MNBD_GAMMA26-466 [hydrothermal vent metagenome]|uniref:Cytochrome c domain-containing protein n=1 Tax=hydrothermal vent metagenome TaxID=652676 RepID=A0A3B1AY53_9ZZZZ
MFKKAAVVISFLLTSCMAAGTLSAADGAALYVEKTCIACHGANGNAPAMNSYPKLGGQNEPYLLAQMKVIKDGTRKNSHSISMTNIMHRVSDEEMATIAKWLAGIK